MLTGIRQMEMRQVPDPLIMHPTDVKIRMKVLGICGSDIHYYVSGKIGNQVVRYPFTVGHEGAGEVVETGPGVQHIAVGDRIAIEPAISCFACDQCLSGRPHTCRHLRFLGCPGQAEGCLSELLVMPESSCFPIPNHMTYDEAAISEPLAIGLYAVKQSIPMEDATIGILGFGPIGMSVMLSALAKGASKVYVTDKIEGRVARATDLKADWAGNPDTEDIVEAIMDHEPKGLDAIFECCGQQDAMNQAVDLLKPGGKIMIVGIPEIQKWTFSVDKLRHKEITLGNVRRQNHTLDETLDMLSRQKVDITSMVSHRFPFEKTKEGFDMVAGYHDGVMKAMIDF